MIGRYLIVAACVLICACSRVAYDYVYIRLVATSGLELVQSSRVALEGIVENTKIPTEYELSRDRYRLRIHVTDSSPHPHLKILLDEVSSEAFELIPNRDVSVRSSSGAICSSYYMHGESPKSFVFAWSADCRDYATEKVLAFSVKNLTDGTVFEERLYFELEENGKYYRTIAL